MFEENPVFVLAASSESIGSRLLWGSSIAGLVVRVVADFMVTSRPHAVSMREAVGWSVFYLALPLVFALALWATFGVQAVEFIAGFVAEKSLSVDNLFVFMLLLAGFAVSADVQPRVLLFESSARWCCVVSSSLPVLPCCRPVPGRSWCSAESSSSPRSRSCTKRSAGPSSHATCRECAQYDFCGGRCRSPMITESPG